MNRKIIFYESYFTDFYFKQNPKVQKKDPNAAISEPIEPAAPVTKMRGRVLFVCIFTVNYVPGDPGRLGL